MKTVRMKMTLLFCVLIVLICMGLATASFGTSATALLNKSKSSMESLAVQAGKAVEAKLSSNINGLDSLSYCETFSHMGDITGYESKIIDILKAEKTRGGYLHTALVDSSGNALFDDGSYDDMQDQDYFKKAFSGEFVVTEPIFSDNGVLVMVYAVPVRSNNSITGVLIGIRDGFELGALAGETANGETGSAFIINDLGNTLAHSNEEMMETVIESVTIKMSEMGGASADGVSSATQNVETEDNSTTVVEDTGSNNYLGYTNFSELQKNMTDGNTGNGEYKYNGVHKILGYAPIENYGWSIGLEINESEALLGINELIVRFVLIALLFLALAMLVVYFVAKQLSNPIVYLTDICYQMSMGDYSVEPMEKYKTRKDEMGRLALAFHAIAESAKALLQENSYISKQITNSSLQLDDMINKFKTMMDEISLAVEQIADGNMDQAEGTQNGAQQVNDMQALIEQEQENMLGLQNSSDKVERLKEEGFTILNDLVIKTEETNQLTKEIYQVIKDTNEGACKIADLSNMIGSITNQTKLLALNASIEAARAGESGKGFTVVATEVKALAESTEKLSNEIAEAVTELNSKSLSSIEKMDIISNSVVQQTQSVTMTQSKFVGIAEAIEETRNNIQILIESIDEMDSKKNEVVRIIMELSATSEENASGTEEVSVSVQEQSAYLEQIAGLSSTLADMAEELDEYINKYKF